eukprot:404930-Pyramimonas_sp.AAC.1
MGAEALARPPGQRRSATRRKTGNLLERFGQRKQISPPAAPRGRAKTAGGPGDQSCRSPPRGKGGGH